MQLSPLNFPPSELPASALALREEVRDFLASERRADGFEPHCDGWLTPSFEFSRKMGQRGYLGVTWPKRYGGHERSQMDRFVITAEVLAWGAPVAAHWIADRQTGPLLLRVGSEAQRQKYLPRIAAGEYYFAIGMSEPDAGSDLANVRTTATPQPGGGWLLNGAKVWTSNAHEYDAMVVFCRTAPRGENRHQGFSQFMVERTQPGVTINPIKLITGQHHFNEVVFDNVVLASDQLLGTEGDGWAQVTSELALERSGPERFMSTYPLLVQAIDVIGPHGDQRARYAVAQLVARIWTLYHMSLRAFGRLAAGHDGDIEAVVVKELGARLEKNIAETLRLVIQCAPSLHAADRLQGLMAKAILHSPSFSLRGGTSEIMRGIIARGLGLR
jgi:alkylation response protein AidB-like acyl-CoA dehydrogenase